MWRLLVLLVLFAAGCTITDEGQPAEEPEPTPSISHDIGVAAPNGRAAPWPPVDDPDRLAELLVASERAIREPATPDEVVAERAHLQQVIYRMWSRRADWDEVILAAVPADLTPAVRATLEGRREFLAMDVAPQESVPAWEIVEPEPPEALLTYYQEAEVQSGIEWEYLAAINLVETGMGRIRGLSTAGARGPMQFIPTTWDEVGEGSIDDPRDSILAAGRYLVQRGGPADMQAALFGYNPDENYVRGVTAFAEAMLADPGAYVGYYNWEIYFHSSAGELWLPVGLRHTEPVAIDDYLAGAPWSNPRPG